MVIMRDYCGGFVTYRRRRQSNPIRSWKLIRDAHMVTVRGPEEQELIVRS
jgi:hypothetical protein